MREFDFDGQIVKFDNFDNATKNIAKDYLVYVNEHKVHKDYVVDTITIHMEGEEADLNVVYQQTKPKIERIRRITGYLSGDTTTWNDAKRAEERDRVKHI